MKLLVIFFLILLFVFQSNAQDSLRSKLLTIDSSQVTSKNKSFPKITINNNRYYFGDANGIEKNQSENFYLVLIKVNNYSLLKNIPELKESLDLVKRNIKRQKTFLIAGIPCFAVSIGVLAMSFMTSTAIGPNGNDKYATIGAFIGGTILSTGFSFEIASIANQVKRKKHLNKAIGIYNRYI